MECDYKECDQKNSMYQTTTTTTPIESNKWLKFSTTQKQSIKFKDYFNLFIFNFFSVAEHLVYCQSKVM